MNPVIGRFTQEDTYRGDGLNLYTYCQNNPVYYVDPSGHICENRAKEIMNKLGRATKNEQKKLAAYLRNKERHGGLTDAEISILKRLDPNSSLNNKISQAVNAQKISSDLSDKYGFGEKPKKTVASDGSINTLSGWKILDDNSEFTRVLPEKVIAKSNEIGHDLRNTGANDQGVPGRYNASHAEKQLSIVSDNPIGISQPMCLDCQNYFNKLASSEGKTYVTADPHTIRIFEPDDAVTVIKRERR